MDTEPGKDETAPEEAIPTGDGEETSHNASSSEDSSVNNSTDKVPGPALGHFSRLYSGLHSRINLKSVRTQRMLMALGIMAVIYVAQTVLANWGYADYSRAWTFAYLQGFLPDTTEKRLQVVVLDLGEVPGGVSGNPLDRQTLWKLIDALHFAGAAVVGIDNDFSPTPNGFRVPHGDFSDPKFFAHCQQWPDMPVVLGVYKNAKLRPNAWLGKPEFRDLAAYVGSAPVIDDARQTRAEIYFADESRTTSLPSMGYALALKYVTRQLNGVFPHPGPLLSLVVEPVNSPERVQLINFSKLGQMTRESVWLPGKDPARTEDLTANADPTKKKAAEQARATELFRAMYVKHYFDGKIVLLGDINMDNPRVYDSSDRFTTPAGREEPGVLYHASAAYTFGFAPIYEFRDWVRTSLEFLLGGIFLFAVWFQTRPRPQSKGLKSKIIRLAEQYALIVAALLLASIAFVSIRYFNILWLDAAWIALGLLVHSALPPYVKEIAREARGDHEGAS